MKYILVTGGAGFIGSNLCKRLLEDKNNFIYCIDSLVTGSEQNLNEIINSERFMFCVYDITNKNTLKELSFMRIDEIYHLASIASPPKYKEKSIETLFTNFEGTRNILELALKYNAKFLFTSTSEVYGDPEINPQVESYWGHVNPNGIRACYDEGKRAAETLFSDYHRQHDIDVRIPRIFNTYGPRMALNDGRVVSTLIVQALKNEDLTLFGDGTQTRSFCYVEDLISGLIKLFFTNGINEPLNLGNPAPISMNQLAQEIIDITNSRSRIKYTPLPSDDPKLREPDISKAKKLIGWEPRVERWRGLELTARYFEKQLAL
jgi:UDP-glucuronate decarboxylase